MCVACASVWVHMGARSWHWVSSSNSLLFVYFIFLKQGLSLSLELTDSVKLPGQQAPGCSHSLLTPMLMFQTPVVMSTLCQKH